MEGSEYTIKKKIRRAVFLQYTPPIFAMEANQSLPHYVNCNFPSAFDRLFFSVFIEKNSQKSKKNGEKNDEKSKIICYNRNVILRINCQKRDKKMHYTYMVKCGDGTLYTGYTTDVLRRTKEHNRGKGAKYTRSRLPVELVYYEMYDSKTDAMKREYNLKQLTRVEKLKLIEEFHRGEKEE